MRASNSESSTTRTRIGFLAVFTAWRQKAFSLLERRQPTAPRPASKTIPAGKEFLKKNGEPEKPRFATRDPLDRQRENSRCPNFSGVCAVEVAVGLQARKLLCAMSWR